MRICCGNTWLYIHRIHRPAELLIILGQVDLFIRLLCLEENILRPKSEKPIIPLWIVQWVWITLLLYNLKKCWREGVVVCHRTERPICYKHNLFRKESGTRCNFINFNWSKMSIFVIMA